MVRMARLIDITRCTACRGCQVACKQWNQLEGEIGAFTGSYQSHEDLSPKRWTMIRFYEGEKPDGEFQWTFRKDTCMHCGNPGCLKACPNNAIKQSEQGAVYRVEENCIGCGYCVRFCPFGIPKVDKELEKMKKCSFCLDRISNNLEPACAKACVTKTIKYGPRDEMVKLAAERLKAAKVRFPKANIYGKDDLDGLGVIYVLPDSPDKYGLPVNPELPFTLGLWKSIFQPFGNILMGTSLVVTGAAFLFTRRDAWKSNDIKEQAESTVPEGGNKDGEQ